MNNTWYNSITSNYKDMLEKGTYYLGAVSSSDSNYKLAICENVSTLSTKKCTKTSTRYVGYVGLPRYGEMFATQQGSNYSNSSSMWLITPDSTSYAWDVDSTNFVSYFGPTFAFAARPSIELKSNVVIKDGSGIESDPYEVSLP